VKNFFISFLFRIFTETNRQNILTLMVTL